MKHSRSRWFTLMSILWVVGAFAQPPEYELDLHWPKIPMGDNWLTGGIGGIAGIFGFKNPILISVY